MLVPASAEGLLDASPHCGQAEGQVSAYENQA